MCVAEYDILTDCVSEAQFYLLSSSGLFTQPPENNCNLTLIRTTQSAQFSQPQTVSDTCFISDARENKCGNCRLY